MYESATVVTSFFEVVVMVPKLIIAVVVFVITTVEGDSVVDFPVGESFKVLEESIAIRKGLLTFEPVAVVVWEAIVGTPVVIADNEDIEILEIVGNALATNVVIFADNAERVISTEDVLEVVRLDVLAVKTDSTFMVEFILSWGIVAIPEASVAIGVAVVAFNGPVAASITAVDDTTILTEVAVVICETRRVTDVSVISGLGKDDLVTEKMRIADEPNTEITFSVAAFAVLLEFVAAISDGLASVAEGDMVADSAAEVRFKAVADFVGITMNLVAIESGAIVVSLKFSVVLVVVLDNEDIDGVLEIVVGIIAANVVILLDVTGRVKSSGVLIEVMRLDLLAVGTVALVRVELMVCWNVPTSNVAGVVINLTVVGNGEVGEMFTVVVDTTVLMREAAEVSKASTLIEVFVVSSLRKDFVVTEDVETVATSTKVDTSSFAAVIMETKLVTAFFDAVIRVTEGDTVVSSPVGEIFEAVEKGKGIGMALVTVSFVAVVVWAAVVLTLVMIPNDEDIEVVFEVVGINLAAANVVIFSEITEPVTCIEDVLVVVRLDVLAVRIDSVFMGEFAVPWGVAVSAGASVVIGVTAVAFNGVLITTVDDTTIPTEVAVVICETSSAIDASVISSLEKDDLVTEKMGIVGEPNTEITFSVTAFVKVLEFVAAISDGLASVAEGDMVADSAAEVRFKAVADFVGITMNLVAIESGAIVVSLKFSVVLVVVLDNEDIDGVLEIVVGIIAANVVILLDVTGRVKSSGVLIEVMRLDLLAVGTVAPVSVVLMVCWNVAISTIAGVVIDLTAVGNGEVGEMFTVVGDTVVLMEAVEVLEASTLIDVFIVSSLGEDVLVTEDVETVVKSTIIVTSSSAVVIMVPKLIAAVVGAMIRVVKGERVAGESCKAVEGGKSIGIVLITVGFLAPVMLADNVDIEVVLKFAAIDLATDVVIFTEIIEPAISVEDVIEASKLDLLDVRIDFVFFVEFIVGWGVAVSAGANVEIDVEAVALIGAVGASIAFIVDDTTILAGAAVIACETSTGIEVSVVSNLKKDILVLAKIGIDGGLNTVVISFVVALVIVFEFVATVVDDVTLAAEGGVEADSAVVEIFKAVKEGVAVSPALIAVSLTAIEFSGLISVTLVVVHDNEDIEGVLEIVGITIPTKVVILLVTVERDNFAEDIIEAVRLDLTVTETVDVERVAIMGRSKVFVSTGAGDVIDIAVFTGNGSVGETIVCDTAVLIRGVVKVFETSTLTEVFVVVVITEDVKMMSDSNIVVTSFSPVVITVLKIVEAVVDVVIPIIEVDRVVEFILGEILKSVEKRIGIRMA